MALSPFFLPMVVPIHDGMDKTERRACILTQRMYVQPYMDVYITRSAGITVCLFFFCILGWIFVPMFLISASWVLFYIALLNTVGLIFYRQVIIDSVGMFPPPEEFDDESED